ncbi:EF-hand domain-containing protein [Bradyrhizobium genosp. L]|uniref:EF-hand domain-containing protein n=1 Tax=Bradyrhizobium genosp. L TaxID=83637 RepID=UPI0018A2C254|nr:EF-hand domain-containing protein [Bradyrhizobium genosp. L]QPF87614.1 EF-hand domain-containing protein [Bradyrhizobium genosp. L]
MQQRTSSICGLITAASLLCTTMPFASAQPASPDQETRRPQAGRDASPTGAAEIWDANRDGIYTCDEWKGYLGRMFDRADGNHDGNLTPKEFASVRRPGSALADADFGYFDENQDGKITRSEFVGKPNEFILQNDKNGDCRVTPEELKGAGSEQKQPGAKGKRF